MSTRARIDRLEAGMTPVDAVLLWVAAVREHASPAAYVGALASGRAGVMTPADIPRLARANALLVSRRPAADAVGAVRTAVRDARFLWRLVCCLNAAIIDALPLERLQHRLVVAQFAAAVAAPVLRWPSRSRAGDAELARAHEAWSAWEVEAEDLMCRIREMQLVSASVERRYFRGRAVLMTDVAAELEHLSRILEPLAALVARPPAVLGPRPPTTRDVRDVDAEAARAEAWADDLVEEARASTYAAFGEWPRAVLIAEARLGVSRDRD